ncbi:metal ABC transporter substrate-binding protein [Lachnospira multipara]|uniref:Zinc transport system substrate-binding protein n=1 Tax=Lachnospira multipara TaxID=28051 RepID=A0A1H5TFA3_9FIRM|nr:metal ABC transporter substrate-binding protein [Lachnospira multipara]SEF61515.1 zinc transport system substrate-binding protein [Lachnospira multipara]
MKSIFKNIVTLALVLTLAVSSLVACGSVKNSHLQSSSNEDAKYEIVCTIFPIYDWVKNIVGDNDNVNVTLLLDQATDLHSFQPTTADIALISGADMFIYVGGESDEWAEDAASEAVNKKQIAVNLMEILDDVVVEEEIKEGMQAEEEDSEEDEVEYDEHVWLSLKNAQTIVSQLTDKISEMDEANQETYVQNGAMYMAQLASLDAEYQAVIDIASQKTLLFGDRFPFRYLVEDYNLDYYAAFVGCSAETEASFETIAFLAEKLKELGLSKVLIIENSDGKIADTVIEQSGTSATKAVLNSMQSVTANDVKDGITYISIMQDNLEVLKEALN